MSKSPPDHPRFPSDPRDAFGKDKGQRGPLPRCRLILHKNEAAELMLIVRAIMELTRFCKHEATHKMWEAYHCGRSLLLITHRERAELYVEQFAGKGVQVTVEPA